MGLPKIVMTDIDGVWTDGGMYYDQTGNEWKKFNTSDSAGILFLRKLNIPVAIITGEDTQIVKRRAQKLGVEHVFQGIQDKVKVAQDLCGQLGISLEEDVAYIGDDLGDMALLSKVRFSAAPDNAAAYVKDLVHFVTSKSGGDGAFREFVEEILRKEGALDDIVSGFT